MLWEVSMGEKHFCKLLFHRFLLVSEYVSGKTDEAFSETLIYYRYLQKIS